jgi:hypothetical protein
MDPNGSWFRNPVESGILLYAGGAYISSGKNKMAEL